MERRREREKITNVHVQINMAQLGLQSPPFSIPSEENLAERLPKVRCKDSVDHRIEKAIEKAQPG